MDPGSEFSRCEYQGEAGSIAEYLARRLAPAAEEAFERHLFACSECWAEVRLAIDLRAATGRGGAVSRPRRTALAAAAVFAVAAVGAGLWWRAQTPAVTVMRGVEASGLTVTLRREADRRSLSWDAVAGAEAYRVVIDDAAGQAIGEVETRATEATIDLAAPGNSGAASARVSALDGLRQTILASPGIPLR